MNVYEIVTARIVELLEKGIAPWRCPWSSDMPRNLVSGKEYRGVNVLLLQAAGFSSPYFVTFKQARALGGNVRRGARGYPVVFWSVTDREDQEGEPEKAFLLRYYTVFNVAEQTDGIELPAQSPRVAVEPDDACETIVGSYHCGPSIEHGGARACYVPQSDRVHMPRRDTFASSAEYYSTLFHELTHSSGAAHRLNRPGVTDPIRFGSHGYAKEELIAECGAAFLAMHAGISLSTIENSAAYLASWAKKLRNEPRWIVEAASHASKAADLIMGLRSIDMATEHAA